MSTSLPPAVLRAALTKVFGSGPVSKSDGAMQLVAEALEEAGFLVVARADVHALRAAADKVLRYSPAPRGRHEYQGAGVRCTDCNQARGDQAMHW